MARVGRRSRLLSQGRFQSLGCGIQLDPKNFTLSVEVVEKRIAAYARSSGNLIDGSAGVAVLDKQLEGGLLEKFARGSGRATTEGRARRCHTIIFSLVAGLREATACTDPGGV